MAVSEYKQVCATVSDEVYDNIFDAMDAYFRGKGKNDLVMTFVLKRRQNVETWVNQAKKAITSNWVRYVKGAMITDEEIHGAYDFFEKYGSVEVMPFTYENRDSYESVYGKSNADDDSFVSVKFLTAKK